MPNVKTGKRMTKMSFLELFKLEKDKRGIVSSSSKSKKGEKTWEEGSLAQEAWISFF